ncbi:MAG TPA: DnaA regulatory inactivator Hda, partial [Plasticicumulans sp.]|nr:DnaA regulatory inactivator Hda [Plasticicumulans sp.]
MKDQMPLKLAARERASFDNYVPGANLAVLEHLRRYTGSPGEPVLYLHGPDGSGRTHLVQAVCSAAAARGQTTV